jgi:hypothetical protein
MKTLKTIFVLVLLPTLLFAQDKVKKDIETQPGKTLDLELSTGGSIEITVTLMKDLPESK